MTTVVNNVSVKSEVSGKEFAGQAAGLLLRVVVAAFFLMIFLGNLHVLIAAVPAIGLWQALGLSFFGIPVIRLAFTRPVKLSK